MNIYQKDWTKAEIERAVTMKKNGMTYSEIAEAMGRTRSSVAGMFYRHVNGDRP